MVFTGIMRPVGKVGFYPGPSVELMGPTHFAEEFVMLKHYLVLNVSPDAGDEEIRASYIRMVKTYTPEKHPEMFRRVTEAYDALKDERLRVETRVFGSDRSTNWEEGLRSLIDAVKVVRKRIGLKEIINNLND